MIAAGALFFGVSVGCIVWLAVRAHKNRVLVAGRLAEIPELSFPRRDRGADIDQFTRDPLLRSLFLAGLRSQKNVRFFRFLILLSFILPLLLAAVFALSGSLSFKNLLVAAAAGVALFIYTRLFIRALKQKRQRRLLRALPQFLDLIVVGVGAGLGFISALERILGESDPQEPLIQEFNLMYHEFLGGLSLADACGRLDRRCEVPDLSVLLSAIMQSDQMGSSLGNTLRAQSAEQRDKLRQRIRARAYQIPVKILFPMMLIFMAFILLNLGYIVVYQMGVVLGGSKGGGKLSHTSYRT